MPRSRRPRYGSAPADLFMPFLHTDTRFHLPGPLERIVRGTPAALPSDADDLADLLETQISRREPFVLTARSFDQAMRRSDYRAGILDSATGALNRLVRAFEQARVRYRDLASALPVDVPPTLAFPDLSAHLDTLRDEVARRRGSTPRRLVTRARWLVPAAVVAVGVGVVIFARGR
jgi:hypothetical protein